MSYTTLMVRLELGSSNDALLKATADLAARHESAVIGVAVCRPAMIASGTPYYTGDVALLERQQLEEDAKTAEAEFKAALSHIPEIRWRAAITAASLCEHVAQQARAADLLVTTHDRAAGFTNAHHLAIGDLVMRAGRPVLIVPRAAHSFTARHVMLAWKETREARRAAADAVPLMQQADQVSVVEVAERGELDAAQARTQDVATWLSRHGIVATAAAHEARGGDALRLAELAQREAADVIVAGAYGHSRVREWAFGGVTYDLLMATPRAVLLSH